MISLPDQIKQESMEKMVDIANKILDDQINFVKGCREIYRLRSYANNPENDIFNTFVLVVTDTDHIPIDEKVRENFGSDYLKKSDKEMEEYFNFMKPTIINACQEIINQFGKANIKKFTTREVE